MEKEKVEVCDASDKLKYLLQKEIMTFEEACWYLGRSASFMYKLTSGRLIPYYVPSGKLIYFKRVELDEWALQHRRSKINEVQKESDSFFLHYHLNRKR